MENDFILVLDLGGPQAVATARKLRNQSYYTQILSDAADLEVFRRKSPRGILIVGGDEAGVAFPRAVLSLGIPVLAMGSAARLMLEAEGARSEGVLLENSASQISFSPCELFDQLSDSDRYFVRIDGFAPPPGYKPIATTLEGLTPAYADLSRNLYALQFYAESNDPDGAVILSNFAHRVCGCSPIWSMEGFIEQEVQFIRDRVGDGHALAAVSGGVDSAVCAMLMHRAIGDRLKCVFVDNGLLRAGEADAVRRMYDDLGLSLIFVDGQERFLSRLKGIRDPIEKHAAIHNEFINVLSEVCLAHPEAEYMVEGTIYSDLLADSVAEGAYERKFATGQLLQPIRMLFKDEVRQLGEVLGMPAAILARQSFPGPALAVRITGEITPEKLALVRQADAIFREEIRAAGQDKRLSQYFAILTETRALGRRDGAIRYEYSCVLRAVSAQGTDTFAVGKLPHDLLERVSQRITGEIPGIGRVVYDITDSAHALVEWE